MVSINFFKINNNFLPLNPTVLSLSFAFLASAVFLSSYFLNLIISNELTVGDHLMIAVNIKVVLALVKMNMMIMMMAVVIWIMMMHYNDGDYYNDAQLFKTGRNKRKKTKTR